MKMTGNVSDWLSYAGGALIKVADSAGSTVVCILQFRDGGLSDSPLLGSYCGIYLPMMFITSDNQLRVEFKSDWSARGQGFLFNWTATSDMPITTQPPTAGTTPGTVQANMSLKYTPP